jgi:hypothetical protein
MIYDSRIFLILNLLISLFKFNNGQKNIYCDACESTVEYIKNTDNLLLDKFVLDKFNHIILCQTIGLVDSVRCDQFSNLFNKKFITIAKESPLTSHNLCAVLFNCASTTNKDIPFFDWNLTISSKPPVKPISPVVLKGAPTIRILHLSDIHIDYEYVPDSLSECDQPLCCRSTSTQSNGTQQTNLAGYWGSYGNCDIPKWTVESMFKYISKKDNVSFKFSFNLYNVYFSIKKISLISYIGLETYLIMLVNIYFI